MSFALAPYLPRLPTVTTKSPAQAALLSLLPQLLKQEQEHLYPGESSSHMSEEPLMQTQASVPTFRWLGQRIFCVLVMLAGTDLARLQWAVESLCASALPVDLNAALKGSARHRQGLVCSCSMSAAPADIADTADIEQLRLSLKPICLADTDASPG